MQHLLDGLAMIATKCKHTLERDGDRSLAERLDSRIDAFFRKSNLDAMRH
jgi:hypothetical protein